MKAAPGWLRGAVGERQGQDQAGTGGAVMGRGLLSGSIPE